MKHDLFIQNGINIPEHELEITASRSGGPGGQHVNKTNSRITVRWNVHTSSIPEYAKERIKQKLGAQISSDGDVIVHSSSSRSQQQNKEAALMALTRLVRNALHVSKKRIPTRLSAVQKEMRLQKKNIRSTTKKLRKKRIDMSE